MSIDRALLSHDLPLIVSLKQNDSDVLYCHEEMHLKCCNEAPRLIRIRYQTLNRKKSRYPKKGSHSFTVKTSRTFTGLSRTNEKFSRTCSEPANV